MRAALQPVDLSEKQLQGQILDLLAATGWRHRYHTYRSKKSPTGFPDEVWARERVIFAELKTTKGTVSDTQKRWLRALLDAGAEAYVLRPADVDPLTLVLTARQYPDGAWTQRTPPDAIEAAHRLRQQTYAETQA